MLGDGVAIDRRAFAEECVRAGGQYGISPHYLLGVAQYRSNISDDSDGDRIGPFRFTRAEWNAAIKHVKSAEPLLPAQITRPRVQCIVFAALTRSARDVIISKIERPPTVVELYLQQWPGEAAPTLTDDLQRAVDATASLIRSVKGQVLGGPSNGQVGTPIMARLEDSGPPARTATSLLIDELKSLNKRPTPMLIEIFALAGRLAPQRKEDNGQLTTSLILFAAIGLDSTDLSDAEAVFRTRLSVVVVAFNNSSRYRERLIEYFGSIPDFRQTTAEPRVEKLSENTGKLLRSAAGMSIAQTPEGMVGIQACIIALLDLPEANAHENLRLIGIGAAQLSATLKRYLRELEDQLPPPEKPPQSDITPPPDEPPPFPSPQARGDYISRFNNDAALASDLLSINDEVKAFARLAASRDVPPPLSIGVFGDWGAGKSFFMERMYAEIGAMTRDPVHRQSKLFYTDIVQIRFNAWHYIETNLWASLVEYIFSELDRWLRGASGKEQVDALFEQLATSRQLKLDSYQDLIATRRDLRAAEAELETARTNNARATEAVAAKPLPNPWPKVVGAFLRDASADQKNDIRQAVDDLGLAKVAGQARTSASELAALVTETRTQAARARTLGAALVARLGSRRGAAIAVLLMLGAPLAAGFALWALQAICQWQWLNNVSSTIFGLLSSASAMIAVAGAWLKRAREGLDRLDRLRESLEADAARELTKEQTALAEAQREADQAQREMAEAEKRVAAAKDREIAAKQDFVNETARGRLNRFIRGKVADASYAKHLGIIASIRKDFGQLTDLMQSSDADQSDAEKPDVKALKEEIRKSNEQHVKKLDELLTSTAKEDKEWADGEGGPAGKSKALLTGTERDELEKAKKALEEDLKPAGAKPKPAGDKKNPDLPSFERIILYIDDLDRCPPDKVVEVLQAIHLLLYFRLFVVVVAVDARWVSRSLMVRYKDLIVDASLAAPAGAAAGTSSAARKPADAQDYLEKIFQIPYWVSRMDDTSTGKFVSELAKAFVGADTSQSTGDAAGREAEAPAKKSEENPPPDQALPAGTSPVTVPAPIGDAQTGVSSAGTVTPEPDQNSGLCADDTDGG